MSVDGAMIVLHLSSSVIGNTKKPVLSSSSDGGPPLSSPANAAIAASIRASSDIVHPFSRV
jgi:hypothetical protein